jgi:hypothetical protein
MKKVIIPSNISKTQSIRHLRGEDICCDYDIEAVFNNEHTILVYDSESELATKILNDYSVFVARKH